MSEFGIERIQEAAARLKGRVVRTPALSSPMLDELAGAQVFVKAEALQRTGSFKYRGALNKLLTLDATARARGVIGYSAGNHGHALAAAAHQIRCPAVIVLPNTAPANKVANCRWWGAECVFYDQTTEDREEVARRISEPRGLLLVPPFDDFDIMAGQGTAGLEFCEQLDELDMAPDALLVCCSGGGIASGASVAIKHRFPAVACYVVEPVGLDKMARSIATGVPRRSRRKPIDLLAEVDRTCCHHDAHRAARADHDPAFCEPIGDFALGCGQRNQSEPHRVSRRLPFLRGWSHDEARTPVFP